MCPPDYFGVEYEINSWMEGNIGKVKQTIAQQQWQQLYEIMTRHSQVHLLPSVPGLPDLCFTANAGLVRDQEFIISHFRFIQRRREEPFFCQWFNDRGYTIKKIAEDITFEGEGDALFQPGESLLWLGYNMRTSFTARQALENILALEVIPLHLINPRFYHLDTCFVPLPGGRVVYYPAAFDAASLDSIHARIPEHQRWAVSDEDALGFACNAIISDQQFICNTASLELRTQLQEWGFSVTTTPLTEFILAGGAAKCLALNLTQNIPSCSK